MPEIPAKEAKSDFYFIDRAEPEQIATTLLDMVKKRIPAKFRFDPIRDIQMLCPMNRGSLGIRELNVKLQGELNPARPEEPVVEKFGWQFRVRAVAYRTPTRWPEDRTGASLCRTTCTWRIAIQAEIGSSNNPWQWLCQR
jgi:exodeoxyribonuclease V alpha subunit